MKSYHGLNMSFKCINETELKSKGLSVPVFDFDFPYDINLLNRHTVLIYDTATEEITYHTVHVPRTNEQEIWIITEDSYTDNLDNETFTYFKFKYVCESC